MHFEVRSPRSGFVSAGDSCLTAHIRCHACSQTDLIVPSSAVVPNFPSVSELLVSFERCSAVIVKSA